MANTSDYIVGGFSIAASSDEAGRRLYQGIGDPNLLMLADNDFFIPRPKPMDRYLQLDADPMIEWVFTSDGFWVELSSRYDREPPDYTEIFEVVKAEL